MLHEWFRRYRYQSKGPLFETDFEEFLTSEDPKDNGWVHTSGPEDQHISFTDMDNYGFAATWGWNVTLQWNNDATGRNNFDYAFPWDIRATRIVVHFCASSQSVGDSGTFAIRYEEGATSLALQSIVTARADSVDANNSIWLGSDDTNVDAKQKAIEMEITDIDFSAETFTIRFYEFYPGTTTPPVLRYEEFNRSFQNTGLEKINTFRVRTNDGDNLGFSNINYIRVEGNIV